MNFIEVWHHGTARFVNQESSTHDSVTDNFIQYFYFIITIINCVYIDKIMHAQDTNQLAFVNEYCAILNAWSYSVYTLCVVQIKMSQQSYQITSEEEVSTKKGVCT